MVCVRIRLPVYKNSFKFQKTTIIFIPGYQFFNVNSRTKHKIIRPYNTKKETNADNIPEELKD